MEEVREDTEEGVESTIVLINLTILSMKLILVGGGSENQSKESDLLFTSLLKNKNILYIPIAMHNGKYSYSDCYKWCSNMLSRYGDFNITMWDEEKIEEHRYEDLLNYGGEFIGGGNTFYLLKTLKELGFDKSLKRLLTETDIPISGGSAGALIFAKTIETANSLDPNNVNLKNLDGLNMINGNNIFVHYEQRWNSDISNYIKKSNQNIITIPENSGIFVDNRNISVIGEGDVKVFPEGKVYRKDAVITV